MINTYMLKYIYAHKHDMQNMCKGGPRGYPYKRFPN